MHIPLPSCCEDDASVCVPFPSRNDVTTRDCPRFEGPAGNTVTIAATMRHEGIRAPRELPRVLCDGQTKVSLTLEDFSRSNFLYPTDRYCTLRQVDGGLP